MRRNFFFKLMVKRVRIMNDSIVKCGEKQLKFMVKRVRIMKYSISKMRKKKVKILPNRPTFAKPDY